jgi:hypothetical protein
VTVTEVSQQYTIAVPGKGFGGATATCPAGQILTGGGWDASGPNVKTSASNMTNPMDGWNAWAFNATSSSQDLWTHAICLSFNDTFFSVNDDDPSISYHGTWTYVPGHRLGDYLDDLHATSNNGDYFEYTFYGTGVDYITEKSTGLGNVNVYIDTKLAARGFSGGNGFAHAAA